MSEVFASIGARARERGLDIGLVALGFPPDVGGIETHLGQLAQEWPRQRSGYPPRQDDQKRTEPQISGRRIEITDFTVQCGF